MPELSHLLTFIFASLALAMTPGPDLIYVILRGGAQGPLAGFTAAAGLATGILGHTVFCMIGISALLATSSLAFTAIKLIGAAYLIYLGITMWRRAGRLDFTNNHETKPLWSIYRQTIIMNLLNPKVALFFLAFLPQFVSPNAGSPVMQLGFLGFIFFIIGFFVMASAGLASGWILKRLTKSEKNTSILEKIAATLMVGLGVGLAVQK